MSPQKETFAVLLSFFMIQHETAVLLSAEISCLLFGIGLDSYCSVLYMYISSKHDVGRAISHYLRGNIQQCTL